VPPKIRDLERDLARAGFAKSKAKGSHRKWTHPTGYVVMISGQGGDDAHRYQKKDVEEAIAAVAGKTR
jgi:predicted RNA binding protein YcfA (HicA-like mRNA interferase family)